MIPRAGDVSGLTVGHIIDTDGPGGAEQVLAHLASGLQAAGARNVAILPANGEGWLGRRLEGSGVQIEYCRMGREMSPLVASVGSILARHRVDVAHSHEFAMGVYGACAAWQTGVPHVITMHGDRYYASRFRRRLALRAAIALSGRTIAVSTPLARHITRDLWIRPGRITTIANGVPHVAAGHAALRAELRLAPADRLVLAVGNLYPVKGHRHLIEAVALLASRWPTLHVAIAGRGQLAEPLRACAREHGISDRVHLLGLRSDIAALLEDADAFVLPSLSEGLPLALLEAMFAGRPIVATNVGEVAVALGNGEAGIVVEPGRAAALAAAIDRLFIDPAGAQTMARCAARRAAAEYDVSQMVRRYVDVYIELLRRRSCRRQPHGLVRKLFATSEPRALDHNGHIAN